MSLKCRQASTFQIRFRASGGHLVVQYIYIYILHFYSLQVQQLSPQRVNMGTRCHGRNLASYTQSINVAQTLHRCIINKCDPGLRVSPSQTNLKKKKKKICPLFKIMTRIRRA